MSREVEIRSLAGKVIGPFSLDVSTAVWELKQLIAKSGGPLPEFQKLVCGEMILNDEQRIEQFAAASENAKVDIALTTTDLEIDSGSQIKVYWNVETGSGNLLENLCFQKSTDKEEEWKCENKGWTMSPVSSYNNCGVLCVGMDPNSGLLLLTHSAGEYSPDWTSLERALLLPSVGCGYEIPVNATDPVARAFEIHVMQDKSFSAPVGVAVALVWKEGEEPKHNARVGGKVLQSSANLMNITFGPGFLKTSALCQNDAINFEAVCLDRSAFPPRAICAERHADGTHYFNIRQQHGRVEELFSMTSLGHSKRITSIAWVGAETSSSVLFTISGSHTIEIYRNAGEGWQPVAVVGGSRGCQDGPLNQCLFWFPCPDLRVPVDDSHPLITGQDGAVFVYSGGVLMKLSCDLTTATKVASMRQELWLTESDEGTPEFPDIHGVYGVYADKIYRGLTQNFGEGGWLIRRLQISTICFAPRQAIRRTAPKLWPNLTEHKVFDINDPDPDAPKPICGGKKKSVRPLKYNEEDRDRWDGDCRWMWDDYLWEGCEMPLQGKGGKGKGKGKKTIEGKGKGKDSGKGEVTGKRNGEGAGEGKGTREGKGKSKYKGEGKVSRKGKSAGKGKGGTTSKGTGEGKGKGKDKGKGKTKDKPKWRPKEQ